MSGAGESTRGAKGLMGCAPGRGAARRCELQRFQGVRPAPGAVPEGVCRAINVQIGRRGARVGVALWAQTPVTDKCPGRVLPYSWFCTHQRKQYTLARARRTASMVALDALHKPNKEGEGLCRAACLSRPSHGHTWTSSEDHLGRLTRAWLSVALLFVHRCTW